MNMFQRSRPDSETRQAGFEIELTAAIVAVNDDEPQILTVRRPPQQDGEVVLETLPVGAFDPARHRTLEDGLNHWVEIQTGLALGYAEQLYTFGGMRLEDPDSPPDRHIVSVGYLALTRSGEAALRSGSQWRSWYAFLPWEDWRDGKPAVLKAIEPKLKAWAETTDASAEAGREAEQRRERMRIAFGLEGARWDEEKALDRFSLLDEAGLLEPGALDGGPGSVAETLADGATLRPDHRRVLATAMGRLRGKLKYRPVIFELMPEELTLFELQRTVEAILGSHLHKQNFRRLVETGGLVEATGDMRTHTGGRPAKLFRFRREVLMERPAPGMRVRAAWS